MSRCTTTVAITREAHISSILQSFSTHFIILFSKFRESIGVMHIIYYSPADIEYSRVTSNLRILSECIRNDGVRRVPTIWQFVRLYSPVLDSNVLSGYLSLNTKTKTFIQILIYQFRHYPVGQSSNNTSNLSSFTSFSSVGGSEGIGYRGRDEGSDNSNVIIGMTLTLKGRIPTESIKPRKTVQSFIVGSHYSTQPVPNPNRGWGGRVGCGHVNMSDTSSTTNSNYELGSYSITVRVTTEGISKGDVCVRWGAGV